MSDARTFRDRVAEHFARRPGQWIDGLELAQTGGAYAWRSRISECRTDLGMAIENRQRRCGRRCISEYRYVPAPVSRARADRAHMHMVTP